MLLQENKLQDFEAFSRAVDEIKNPDAGLVYGMASDDRRQVAAYMVNAAEKIVPDARLLQIQVEAERFAVCGSAVRVYRCPKDNHRYRGKSSCNSRICPTCSKRYGRQVTRKLRDVLRPFWAKRGRNTYGPKFLTLTFKRRYETEVPSPSDLKLAQKQVRDFLRLHYSKYAMRRSRNGRLYADRKKYRGCGAVALPEIGSKGTLHFHCLVYGPYIPQARLSQSWYDITGDSMVVDIQDGAKLADGCRYVTKYITKPPAKVLTDGVLLAMWGLALKGSRRMINYGEFFGKFTRDRDRKRVGMRCIYCGSKLEFEGIGLDPDHKLIDAGEIYKQFGRDGPGVVVGVARDYADRFSPDKTYEFQPLPLEVY